MSSVVLRGTLSCKCSVMRRRNASQFVLLLQRLGWGEQSKVSTDSIMRAPDLEAPGEVGGVCLLGFPGLHIRESERLFANSDGTLYIMTLHDSFPLDIRAVEYTSLLIRNASKIWVFLSVHQ
jgi:hypothetical protein